MMKILILDCLIGAVVFLAVHSAHAYGESGVLFGLSAFKYETSTEGNNFGESEIAYDYFDGKLGMLSAEWYLGVLYTSYVRDFGAAEEKRRAYGPSLGYHSGGFFLDLTYLMAAELELANGSEANQGTGFAGDLGVNTQLSESLYVGAQISYKTITYTEYKSAGVTTSVDNKQKSEIYPMLNLGLMF